MEVMLISKSLYKLVYVNFHLGIGTTKFKASVRLTQVVFKKHGFESSNFAGVL